MIISNVENHWNSPFEKKNHDEKSTESKKRVSSKPRKEEILSLYTENHTFWRYWLKTRKR